MILISEYPPTESLLGGTSVVNNMENITFIWDANNNCWVHDDIEDTSIFIHKYPPTNYLVSIQHLKHIGISKHEVFESIYAAQTFIELKYNGLVKYRDPQEVIHYATKEKK